MRIYSPQSSADSEETREDHTGFNVSLILGDLENLVHAKKRMELNEKLKKFENTELAMLKQEAIVKKQHYLEENDGSGWAAIYHNVWKEISRLFGNDPDAYLLVRSPLNAKCLLLDGVISGISAVQEDRINLKQTLHRHAA